MGIWSSEACDEISGLQKHTYTFSYDQSWRWSLMCSIKVTTTAGLATATQSMETPTAAFRLPTPDLATSPMWNSSKPFVKAGLSGMGAWMFVQPFDIIKVRIQLGNEVSPVSFSKFYSACIKYLQFARRHSKTTRAVVDPKLDASPQLQVSIVWESCCNFLLGAEIKTLTLMKHLCTYQHIFSRFWRHFFCVVSSCKPNIQRRRSFELL